MAKEFRSYLERNALELPPAHDHVPGKEAQ